MTASALVLTAVLGQLPTPKPMAPGYVTMTDLSFQSHVEIGIGQRIVAKLAIVPSLGDTWTCTWSNGPVLAAVGDPVFEPTSPVSDATGKMVFVVRGRCEGSTMLTFVRRRSGIATPLETLQSLVCVSDGIGRQTVSIGMACNHGRVNLDVGDILQVVLPASGGKWSIVSQPAGLNLLIPTTGNTQGYPSGDWSNQYFRFRTIGAWSGFLNMRFDPLSAKLPSSTFDVYVNIRPSR